MEKIKRSERLGAITRILIDSPNHIHTLGEFCEMFGAAKSTISEDIDLIDASLKRYDLGRLDTVAGAAGGVRYRATPSKEKTKKVLDDICQRLSQPGRVLPGNFLYTADISSDPKDCRAMAEIVAGRFYDVQPDLVITMETKGIPLAMETAYLLDVPLVIARRDSRAYEGSAVKINYLAGSSRERIETMALARRAVQAGQKALIVDDFAKSGGTLKGMTELMHEFQAEVVGVAVMVATSAPVKKSVDNICSLITLDGFDHETGIAHVYPAEDIL